jgi:hypothetical protein
MAAAHNLKPRLTLKRHHMKAYLVTTGSVFGLIVLAHVWRVVEEGPHVTTDPFFILLTAAAAALSLWAWRLLTLMPRR